MAKKNLFIVNTPFHLLTVFVLSNSSYQMDENYLALIHPHGYEKWADSPLMQYLSSVNSGYKEVFFLGNWLSSRDKTESYRAQGDRVKKSLGRLGIDDVFLGSDIDVQNQLLAAALEKKSFYRYEDGLYSYYNDDRRRSLSHCLFHKGKISLMRHLAGLPGGLYINTSTAGSSPAGIGDFMYKPRLLRRFSPKTHEITTEMVRQAVAKLAERDLLHQRIQRPGVLYISQPLVEQKKFTLREEFERLEKIVRALPEEYTFLYKPHPNDRADKLAFYQENLPQIEFYQSVEPVEIAFAYEKNIRAVISYQSTALMFPDKFARHPIQSISLAAFYKQPLHSAYIEIMSGAGVRFPKTLDEVSEMVKDSFRRPYTVCPLYKKEMIYE